jgi:hypothetical protein
MDRCRWLVLLIALGCGSEGDGGKEVREARLGEQCGEGADVSTVCTEGICDVTCTIECETDEQCAALADKWGVPGVNVVCSTNHCRSCEGSRCDCGCPSELSCFSETDSCKSPQPVGERCENHDQCENRNCEAGVCTARKGPGEDCTEDLDCENRDCLAGVCRQPTGEPCTDETCNACDPATGLCSQCRSDANKSYCASLCDRFSDNSLECPDGADYICVNQVCTKLCESNDDCLLATETCQDRDGTKVCLAP